MNNQEIVGKWFNAVWGEEYNPAVIAELASEDMVMKYPLHGERRGYQEIKEMLDELRTAFPDLKFQCTGLIEDKNIVAGKWEGGGTHTGPEFSDLPKIPGLPALVLPENSGRRAEWTGMSYFKIENGKIVSEIGEEDALGAALQFGLLTVK
ncbi:ester cyclase [Flammeovirga kamogawensis]|uniref:Ester cyclase n=1 Tax=Flammeovirga kamogawensis TaxID=373891 RepID=A0ABX8H4B9_9BACT|nr:ester cyclase [Flammeovirga kamogawensis]MBB6461732.1 putative ester cyclase [Flammeovirga kamogawensis]QWG10650.1 ester cyclase [Flammeovirga kamogawensis]TRX63754.1 ester cyclase [Flammeovirga kamogawensis]